MRRELAMILAVSLVAACSKQEQPAAEVADVTTTAPVPTASPVVSSAPADCPVADEAGVVAIADGLQATILSKGYGRAAVMGDQVVVTAELWVHDEAAEGGKGTHVWSSGPDGFGFEIGAGGFIDGWSPGVACMLLGEKRELIIASELAYGERGRAPIPPNADIIYELELTAIAEPPTPAEN